METAAVQLAALHAEAQRAKWSVCTLEPPTVKWNEDGIYACFLSHYKVEAASDARYLHDTLRKILQAPSHPLCFVRSTFLVSARPQCQQFESAKECQQQLTFWSD